MTHPQIMRAIHNMLKALETIDELAPLNPADPEARELAQELHSAALDAADATRKYLTLTKEAQ